MSDIFSQPFFAFPYSGYRFPGQNSDETILFVVRENEVMLWFRRAMIAVVGLAATFSGWLVSWFIQHSFGLVVPAGVFILSTTIGITIISVGWWWVTILWQNSICIVTNKRLTKFVYTTPFNRHSLSLPLEMIVDTGAYTKGFLQALFKLGTLTARSSASSSGIATDDNDRINKKYFYIENVAIAEDLQQYIGKLLSLFRSRQGDLAGFRPFIPHGRGQAREQMMQDHPEYWS